jgi:small subunit ribosomal protein S6
MKKNRKGHYVLFNLDAPAAAVSELERNMRINEDILRYITIRVEELEAGQSAMMRRSERDERDRDRDRGPRRGYGDRDPREEDREQTDGR